MYLSDCLKILHIIPLGGPVVPFAVYELDLHLVQNYDLFRRFDACLYCTLYTCSIRSLVVPF